MALLAWHAAAMLKTKASQQFMSLEDIKNFVGYARTLRGDERGESQVFCDRLFKAFGHEGYKEAGAELEFRVRAKGQTTKYADLLWTPRLLLEMKKRGEKLEKHYQQAFEYWLELVPKRPKYVMLCNFDEFWIYDFDVQLREPVDRVKLEELPDRFTAFNFLFQENRQPQFRNDQVDVTRKAANQVANVFKQLVSRGEDPETSQRYILQCVVALFAEDIDLLPRGLFTELLGDCQNGASSFDLIGGLFRQMGTNKPAPRDSRYKDVPYFNGGIFSTVEPLSLQRSEIELLSGAASERWSKVEPAIFGSLFESSMQLQERHALGAHYTSEADIQKVVLPTIIRPWREKIRSAKTLKELLALREELINFKVLDPACGSGNFLYISYREIKRLEAQLLSRIQDEFSTKTATSIGTLSLVKTSQFYGIDIKPFAVELAKVTLMLAKKLALDEEIEALDMSQGNLSLELEKALPLDNLDGNIKCDDALFCEWPETNAIIGNPPFQSKNKMQQEFGPAYVNKVRSRYPGVPGRADYCVYWFRRTHDELNQGQRAGLVGTNTIRQNYSREGGLDYILKEGGTITEAVSSQVWSGDAVVHVSIVNWIKGDQGGNKKLFTQNGDNRDGSWEIIEKETINSALSASIDVTQAKILSINSRSECCYQGQTHGHEGFLVSPAEARSLVHQSERNEDIIFPYLIGEELLSGKPATPRRYVIDFQPLDILAAGRYSEPLKKIRESVLPARQAAAEEEIRRNAEVLSGNPRARVNRHHQNFLSKWWHLSYGRAELINLISRLPRYIVCVRVTKRPIFEFIDSSIRPNDSLQVFPLSDDYSFGILQSSLHWQWFNARCSTMKSDFRYTSQTVFNAFPFPQDPSPDQIKKVAEAAVHLRQLRRQVMTNNDWSLRDLYRTLDLPGNNPLRSAQTCLDSCINAAYGMRDGQDPLEFLLELNFQIADREVKGLPIVGPGLPPMATNMTELTTNDCVKTQIQSL